jgi:mannosyltransferase
MTARWRYLRENVSFGINWASVEYTLSHIPAWAWLVLIAGPLRFAGLGSESLWYDEAFTSWLTRLDWAHWWQAVLGDVHPPLYYALAWANAQLFGRSEWALRLPSAVLGVVAVLLVWQLALALGMDRRAAFVAGLLAAILPGALYYSQEARMYSLLSCFVLGAALAMIRRRWVWFALLSVGAMYSQNMGVLYVAALCAVELGLQIGFLVFQWAGAYAELGEVNWREFLHPNLAMLAVGLAYVVWVPTLLWQMNQVGAGYWLEPLTAGGTLQPYAELAMGWRMPESLQVHAYVAGLALLLLGLVVSRRWVLAPNGLILLAVVFGTPLLAALASVLWRSIYLPRAFLPSALAMMPLWAAALCQVSKANRRALQIVAVPLLAVGLVGHYFTTAGRYDERTFLQPVREGWQPGDVIYHTALHTSILYGYYLYGLPYELRPYVSDLNQTLTEQTKAAMQFDQLGWDDLVKTGQYRRVWLCTYTNPMSQADELNFVRQTVSHYHATLIREYKTEMASQDIWLIEL